MPEPIPDYPGAIAGKYLDTLQYVPARIAHEPERMLPVELLDSFE